MTMLRFSVPVPTSSKNSRVLTRTRSGGVKSLPNRKAVRAKWLIAGAARQALLSIEEDWPKIGTAFGPDDDIAVRIEHEVEADLIHVEVESIGPKPKGKTGRGRDVDNFASTVLDALNGVAYGDDRQVALLQVKRV